MKVFLATLIAIIIANISFAQTHNELWAKYNFHTKINNRLSASVDINFRQQSNYLTTDKNIFTLPLMRSSRLWIFYKMKNNYAIIGSFFTAKTFSIKNEKAELLNATETQFAIGLSKKIMVRGLENRNRLLIEKRNIYPQNKPAVNQFRYRLQNSLTIPVKTFSATNKLNFVILNELFFKTQQSFTGFDQNRTGGIIQWHYHHYEYNIGFQKTYQSQNDNLVTKNQFLFILNYTL